MSKTRLKTNELTDQEWLDSVEEEYEASLDRMVGGPDCPIATAHWNAFLEKYKEARNEHDAESQGQ